MEKTPLPGSRREGSSTTKQGRRETTAPNDRGEGKRTPHPMGNFSSAPSFGSPPPPPLAAVPLPSLGGAAVPLPSLGGAAVPLPSLGGAAVPLFFFERNETAMKVHKIQFK